MKGQKDSEPSSCPYVKIINLSNYINGNLQLMYTSTSMTPGSSSESSMTGQRMICWICTTNAGHNLPVCDSFVLTTVEEIENVYKTCHRAKYAHVVVAKALIPETPSFILYVLGADAMGNMIMKPFLKGGSI